MNGLRGWKKRYKSFQPYGRVIQLRSVGSFINWCMRSVCLG